MSITPPPLPHLPPIPNYLVSTCVSSCCICVHVSMWQVLLGEVNENLRTNQVVVKELKASASIKEQMHFLEEVQPYRYSSAPSIDTLDRCH